MSPHVAGTTPYPWPYDGNLAGPGTALVVLAPAGSSRPGPGVVRCVGGLARSTRRSGGMVILARTALPDRLGVRTAGHATPNPDDLLDGESPDHEVHAGGIDAFYASDLDLILRTAGISRLLLTGDGLETSVHSTMRDANDRGYECLLVADACAAMDPSLVSAAVSMIEMSGGIFGAVGLTADVLAALARAHPATHTPPEGAPT